MTTIDSLSDELLSLIFDKLSISDLYNIIKAIGPHPNRILILLYQRLFRQTFMIITNKQIQDNPSVISFNDVFKYTGQGSSFQRIMPKLVLFEFVRQDDQFAEFVYCLTKFRYMLQESYSAIRCLENVSTFGFIVYSTPACVSDPMAFNLILDIFKELGNNSNIVSKLHKIVISKLIIGTKYESHMSEHICKFTSLRYLDLSSCFLNLYEYPDYEYEGGMSLPDGLKVLILDHNSFPRITRNFLKLLPNSLEELSMNYNKIREIEPCMLGFLLPNLRSLKLNWNPVVYINPLTFTGCHFFFTVELQTTFLSQEIVDDIKKRLLKMILKLDLIVELHNRDFCNRIVS